MGIKSLNSFLKEKCKDSLHKIDFSELSGKKIVVDVSIYIYKFLEKSMLIENFYLMCMLFRNYNIIPIFVFDGKPPKEKGPTIMRRMKKKKENIIKYQILEEEMNEITDLQKKKSFVRQITILKKKSISIKKQNLIDIKLFFDNYGIQWIVAPGEADIVCAHLVKTKKAYACLSEDMDLFVYGCPRVLRYMSLIHHNFIIYDIDKIIKKLNISIHHFQVICILSGTDYNSSTRNVFYFYRLYRLFMLSKDRDFIFWMSKKIRIQNIEKLLNMFNQEITLPTINITFNEIDKPKLITQLLLKNFIVI